MTVFNCGELRKIIEQGAKLLDVRSVAEFSQNALPNASNIPLPLLPVLAHERLDRNEEILVYCHSGARAQTAIQILNSLGFSQVRNIGGVLHYEGCG
jgi:phage shock protein E